jgi:CheY-like chemotaxis protein
MGERPHLLLVVDDDDELRESLIELLELEGFASRGVRDGREALEFLRGHDPPCLIVLDLMMPVMSGQEFRAEQLRDPALAAIPVVVLTASSRPDRQHEELRALAYFSKPMQGFDAFLDLVKSRC